MELRQHQKNAVKQLLTSFRSGKSKPMIAAPCSFGKTHLAAYLLKGCQDKGKHGIFICDRIKLVDQTIKAFDDWDIWYGVLQADHYLTNYAAPIQIASAQTLKIRMKAGYEPKIDLCIVDEAHVTHECVKDLMQSYPTAKFIGLSATPYSKGLGLWWDDLLVPATTMELLEAGYLCPVHYYAGAQVDTTGVKSRALATGGTDFDPRQLGQAVDIQKEKLTGDIIRNWLEHGENSQTIAFSPSIAHSKYLVKMFNDAGIGARHIDGYTDQHTRLELYKGHDNGEFKILSCSQLLTVGYDSPSTRCLIDCYPVARSQIMMQQRAGRIFRIDEGKEYAIYLDHAGNVQRLGFPEQKIADSLDKAESKFKESGQIREKKEREPKSCPKCSRIMAAAKCSCGFEYNYRTELESDTTMLVRIKTGKAQPDDRKYMSDFYSTLLRMARSKGYSDGWAAHNYKKKFGRWPRSLEINHQVIPLKDAENYILSQQIAWAKRNAA